MADSAGKWPRFEQAVGPIVYARLHGDTELYASGYTDSALEQWAERLCGWTADGREAFVYFDNDMKGYAPHDARRLIAKLDGARHVIKGREAAHSRVAGGRCARRLRA